MMASHKIHVYPSLGVVSHRSNHRRPKKTMWQMLKFEAKQFCLNTALHGYRFIILPKRVLIERVIWAVVVIVALATALTLLLMAWFSFQQNPTVVVTDSTHYPIWYYAFPSVTVCNFNTISKGKVYDFAATLNKSYGISNEDLAEDFRMLSQLLYNQNRKVLSVRDYSRLQDILEINNLTVDMALQKLTPSCQEMLLKCKWKGEEKRCVSIFEQVRTSFGFCCAFNYFALKNHQFSGALPNKAPKKPRKVSACGYETALEVLVDNNASDYTTSMLPSVGHFVLIANPYNFLDWTSQIVLNEMKGLYLIGLNPTITYATDNVKSLPVNKRQCYFPEERELNNFDKYTFHNCLTECRMNLTLQFCGCVPFYYYNPEGLQSRVKLCNLRDVSCLEDNKYLIFSSVPGFDFSQISSNHHYGKEKGACDCLPDCEYVDVWAESSNAPLNRQYSTNQHNLYGDINIENQTVFRVFFLDLVAPKNRRDVIYTWHTLLAYYGGLLGLFVGFSFVSAIELLYFFTIRLFADFSRKKKVGSIELNIAAQFERLDPSKLFPRGALINQNDGHVRFRSNSNSNTTFIN